MRVLSAEEVETHDLEVHGRPTEGGEAQVPIDKEDIPGLPPGLTQLVLPRVNLLQSLDQAGTIPQVKMKAGRAEGGRWRDKFQPPAKPIKL